jgi:hypothetical protein
MAAMLYGCRHHLESLDADHESPGMLPIDVRPKSPRHHEPKSMEEAGIKCRR